MRGPMLTLLLLLAQDAGAARPVHIRGGGGTADLRPISNAIACQDLGTESACTQSRNCSWCVATASGDGLPPSSIGSCFPSEHSALLPPRVFSCQGNSPAGVESVAGDDDAKCAKLLIDTECDGATWCTWCISSFGWDNGSCYSKAHAKFMPRQMFQCDADAVLAAPKREYPASCALITNDDTCEGTKGCTWCAASWDTGICYDAKHSEHLPRHLYDCGLESKRVVKTQAHVAALQRGQAHALSRGDEPGACADFQDVGNCDDASGCIWCTNPWGPALCYDESQARYLPKQYFKCGSKARLEDSDKEEDDEEEEELVPGVDVEVTVECSSIKEEVGCNDEKACTWCTSDYLDKAACFSKTTAQYLPKVFVCDEDDKKVKAVAVAEAEVEAVGVGAVECEDNKYQSNCDGDKTCVWCTSSFADKGSCFTKTAAKFLPPQMFDCSTSGSLDKIDCVPYKEQDSCDDHAECTWCVSTLLSKGACLTQAAAKILPPKMFTCDAVATEAEEEAAAAVEGVAKEAEEDESAAAGVEGGAKVDCVKVKTEAECDDVTECTWCLSTLLDKGACLTKGAAKILPPSMFKCDAIDTKDPGSSSSASSTSSSSSSSNGSGSVVELGGRIECVGEKTEKECDAFAECTWCLSTLLGPGACLTIGASKLVPPSMFICEPKDPDAAAAATATATATATASSSAQAPKKKVDCVKIRAEDDCNDANKCTWCNSTLLDLGACVPMGAAKLLPPTMFSCDALDDQEEGEAAAAVAVDSGVRIGVESVDGVDCVSLKAQGDCDGIKECTWCLSTLVEKAACLTKAAAKLLPPSMFTCDAIEAQAQAQAQAQVQAQVQDHDEDEGDDEEEEEEDDEDEEEAEEHSLSNVDCQPIKDEFSCDDERDCTWCTSSFLERGGCFPKAVAKYLPPHLFTCDGIPSRRHRRHHRYGNEMCDNLAEDQCVAPGCEWCTSAAVGGGCFTPEEAAKLPAAIFHCKTAPS